MIIIIRKTPPEDPYVSDTDMYDHVYNVQSNYTGTLTYRVIRGRSPDTKNKIIRFPMDSPFVSVS